MQKYWVYNLSENEMERYPFPNLLAEIKESGYSYATLSEWLEMPQETESYNLIDNKLIGKSEVTFGEAEKLSRLFSCGVEYLFTDTLKKLNGRAFAYYRHYEINKQLEQDQRNFALVNEIQSYLKQYPKAYQIIKTALKQVKGAK